jgi:hypothetical protein
MLMLWFYKRQLTGPDGRPETADNEIRTAALLLGAGHWYNDNIKFEAGIHILWTWSASIDDGDNHDEKCLVCAKA